jgi:predicted flap endonuclease-1-like 5' DNA nuclease
MLLDQLPGLETEQVCLLQSLGIRNWRQLLRASQHKDRMLFLSQAAKLPPDTLRALIRRLELGRIQGIGPATLRQLWTVGVDSIDNLAEQEPAQLQVCLRQVALRPPNLAVIEDWIAQAQKQKSLRAMGYPR